MNLNIIWRNVTSQKNIFGSNHIQKCVFIRLSSSKKNTTSSSSSSESDDDSKKKSDSGTKNEETITKLNSLLQQLIQNDTIAKKSDLKLARPKDKRLTKEEIDSKKVESGEKKLVKAVTEVAEDIGGDTKQIESELLSKLLSPAESTAPAMTLNEIVKGMKIDRQTKSVQKTKAEQVRDILQNMQSKQTHDPSNIQKKIKTPRYRPKQEMVVKPINLFGSEPLGIFSSKNLKETQLNTWQKLYERDLKLAITHPPANYFQEMILWTEQGKLWKFPINNEQGLEKEMQVDFSKHIFLEEHLESWCPSKGPIRHFMELVCVGLSKNPYLTVEAKIEHIEWYQNYFDEKKKLLQDVGAVPTDSSSSEKQNQIK